MARILTGVQSTGTPHLGNLLGAVLPAIEMAKATSDNSFLFIADLHSLTQIKNGEVLRENTFATAATWLACGLDIKKTHFYRQSDVSEVTELAWYLNCFFPYQRLTLAHSFKDKSEHLEDVNSGLFTYPMLMAACFDERFMGNHYIFEFMVYFYHFKLHRFVDILIVVANGFNINLRSR